MENEDIHWGGYPSEQCRFLTGVSGALCGNNFKSLEKTIQKEEGEKNLVNPARTYCRNSKAKRPACWFPLKFSSNQ